MNAHHTHARARTHTHTHSPTLSLSHTHSGRLPRRMSRRKQPCTQKTQTTTRGGQVLTPTALISSAHLATPTPPVSWGRYVTCLRIRTRISLRCAHMRVVPPPNSAPCICDPWLLPSPRLQLPPSEPLAQRRQNRTLSSEGGAMETIRPYRPKSGVGSMRKTPSVERAASGAKKST